MATGAAAVAGYLWTEIVRIDRRLDGIEQTSQVQLAQIAECQKLGEILVRANPFEQDRAKEMFTARGCVKVKIP